MISRSWRVWDLERIERELRVSSCHPERSEGSARWRVQKLFWSRARDARAPAPRGKRSRSKRAALATPYRHEASGASFPRRCAPRDDKNGLLGDDKRGRYSQVTQLDTPPIDVVGARLPRGVEGNTIHPPHHSPPQTT